MYKISLNFLLLFFLFNFSTIAQNVRINEVVSSNSEHLDEDGDSPDWIELHNYGTKSISLLNWGLTDNEQKLHDWQFPDIILDPDEYLLVWASDKDKKEVSFARTLVNQGDLYQYVVPTSEPNSNWRNINFNDSSWNTGPSGFGFGDGDDATVISKGSTTIFTRLKFTMADVSNLTNLILDVDYDDGFVAYINGVEIARANVNGSPPSYDTTAFTGHEAKMHKGEAPERFIIDNPKSILVDGDNVLSIQGYNVRSGSSDMTLIPFLTAVFSSTSALGVNPPEILELSKNSLHTNFKVSSSSETLILSDENQNIIDQVLVEGLKPNVSWGISTKTNTQTYFSDTTPGEVNSTNEFQGVLLQDILFSVEGGFISSPSIKLELSGNTGTQQIRYTLDATAPNKQSTLYTSPIKISENTVVRAMLFDTNFISSFSQSKTYIFNADHKIDALFLATAPDNFFDNDTGIYVYGDNFESSIPYKGANFWEDWERPIHFSFFNKDTKQIEVEFNAGVKIFGGRSRIRDQRPFSIFARGQYGTSEIQYPFFETLAYDKFQGLIIRNSGNDWLGTSIKDAALTSLMKDSGLDYQAFNPVATYLNGAYWGLYNLREKINEHFLASKHNIDTDDIDLLERNAQVKHGSNVEYNALIDYISSTDLSNDANFEHIKERVDLDNYAIYQATQAYFGNIDWPGNNIRFWKHTNGKWRWILYDTDLGYSLGRINHNGVAHATGSIIYRHFNPEWSTLLLSNLLKNIGFRNKFINRFADELNTRFLPENVKNHIDALFNLVKPEINAHYLRWNSNPASAQNNVDRMKTFAERRHNITKTNIRSEFNLPNYHQITIKNTDVSQGLVKLNNNLKIEQNNWKGDYYETVPITLTAIAKEGYAFSHWSGASNAKEKTIMLSLVGNTSITPNFVQSAVQNIVINEINYKSGDEFNSDDWVELYNPNNSEINVSNWILKDDDDTHVFLFPEDVTIEAKGYLVVVKNKKDFTAVFPDIKNFIGEIGFGFGGNDAIRLYDENEILQDQVDYDSSAPWSTCADGNGPSLELISPDLNNNLATSWECTNEYGTPNELNSSTLHLNQLIPQSFKVYPNPVGANKTIFIKGNDIEKVEIYSVLGKKVFHKNITNTNSIQFKVDNFRPGIYFIRINNTKRSKIIIN